MWQIIKLIQAFMSVLVTCKNEEDPFKNEGASGHKQSPIVSTNDYADFLCRTREVNSMLRLVLLETHPSFFSFPRYLKE